jgi:hypothetical protein
MVESVSEIEVNKDSSLWLTVLASNQVLILSVYVP